MSYELDDETLERFANMDTRYPSRMGDGWHFTDIAGSMESLRTGEIGFRDTALAGDYNDLSEGDYVVVRPTDAAKEDRSYQMKVTGFSDYEVVDALEPEELQHFKAGGAIVAGPDHTNNSYSPWNIDDTAQRKYIKKQGLIPAGRKINIFDVVNLNELDVDTVQLGEYMVNGLGKDREDYQFGLH